MQPQNKFTAPTSLPSSSLKKGRGDIFAIIAKVILLIIATFFVFFGTCLPVAMNTGQGELGNPVNGIFAGLIAAIVFFATMGYFALIRKKIIALVLVAIVLILGVLMFLSMIA